MVFRLIPLGDDRVTTPRFEPAAGVAFDPSGGDL